MPPKMLNEVLGNMPINSGCFSDNEKNAFIAELLNEHNCLRARHQSPPLQVNPKLSAEAQKWAEHLVTIKSLRHSDAKYGENIWYKWSSNKVPPTGIEPIKTMRYSALIELRVKWYQLSVASASQARETSWGQSRDSLD